MCINYFNVARKIETERDTALCDKTVCKTPAKPGDWI